MKFTAGTFQYPTLVNTINVLRNKSSISLKQMQFHFYELIMYNDVIKIILRFYYKINIKKRRRFKISRCVASPAQTAEPPTDAPDLAHTKTAPTIPFNSQYISLNFYIVSLAYQVSTEMQNKHSQLTLFGLLNVDRNVLS